MRYLIEYHPYHRGANPEFDTNSSMLLDFKKGYLAAIDWAVRLVNSAIPSNVAICVVPSHSPSNGYSPLHQLVDRLVSLNHSRVNATSCLVRVIEIPKLSTGGNRSLLVHLHSIELRNPYLLKGKDVVILDDVTTTGNSLEACHEIVVNAHPRTIDTIAIARTV